MKPSTLHKVSLHRQRRAGDLPLELRRQPRSGPAGKGVSFVVAHVTNRFRFFDLATSRTGEEEPILPLLSPVEGRHPAGGLHCLPSVRKPELRPFVPSIRHKSQILAGGGHSRGKAKGRGEYLVPGSLVIK